MCLSALPTHNCHPTISVRTPTQALAYKERILEALGGKPLVPLMTLYLTDDTKPEEIEKARASGQIHAVKL